MKRVLLVDNNDHTINRLVLRLNRMGYDVVTARSAAEALGKIENDSIIELILMHVGGGVSREEYETARVFSSGSRLPIVLLTAAGGEDIDDWELRSAIDMALDSEEDNRRRDVDTRLRFETALFSLSRTLLAGGDSEKAIPEALTHLLEASLVKRVYIFTIGRDPELGPFMSYRYEVCAEGISPELGNPELERIPFFPERTGLYQRLEGGMPYFGITRELSAADRQILEPQGIKSLLNIPVFVNGELYGLIGFDETEYEKEWDAKDIRLLQTAADMIGTYFSRIFYLREINRLLEEKDLLLREVHHRIKNNMSTIISLLQLQLASASNDETVEAIGNAESRIRSMLLLYDKLYRSGNYTETPLREYLMTLIDEIVLTYPNQGNVRIVRRIENLRLDERAVFTMGIVINELLSNAMKYAFPDGRRGTITVTVRRVTSKVEIRVRDNGCGLPEDFDNGFGLRLVELLAQQLEAEYTIKRNEGTVFSLRWAVSG